MVEKPKPGSYISAIVAEEGETDSVDKTELELKLAKIKNMMVTIDERVLVHERKLAKLYKLDEREDTRKIIAKVTQKILASS